MDGAKAERFTQAQIEAALDAQGLRYGVLALQDGATLLLVERGGRAFGPFFGPAATSLFWVNPVLGDADGFAAFLRAGAWNLGGERMWLAPEIQWICTDRSDFHNNLLIPGDYDPGRIALEQESAGMARLRHAATLSAYNLAQGEVSLAVERNFRPAADPLADAGLPAALRAGVRYAGYEQSITLQRTGGSAAIAAQSWVLVQLYAGGEIIVPCTPQPTITDYYQPVDDAVRTLHGHWASFRITGARMYKVGIRAAHHFGRLGYFSAAGGQAALVVRNFNNNPSNLYAEEPWHTPGARGDSLHIYNDDGGLGGFGELEVQGQTIGAATGAAVVRDQLLLWVYQGPAAQVGEIARHLLGVNPLDARSLPM